jgi:hypothetical protein
MIGEKGLVEILVIETNTTLYTAQASLPSNISLQMSHGIGPSPNEKNITYTLTATRAVISLKNPRRLKTVTMQLTNMPPDDHMIKVLRPHRSIKNKAAYVANTLTTPTIVVPTNGLSMTPSKKLVE